MKSNDINNNPWLALATYEEHDHHKFIGRDNDVENLTNLLRQNECIVCYAASGEGKSSLINAGLFPRLKIVNYFPIKISFTVEDEKQKKNSVIDFDELVFSKIEDYLESYNEEIDKRINEFEKEEEKVFLSKFKVKFEALSRYNDVELPDSLWWKLRTRTIHTYAGTTYTPVLIFDQFEEIFRTKWKKDFFKWLEILMKDKCPDENIDDNLITERKLFKVLFSMRHEYVGELDYWCSQRTYIPQMMRNRYFLKPLTTEQARSIILGQDYKNENIEKKFKDNADAIIDICKKRDGDANADEVSAIVLSLVGYVSYDEWSKNDSYSIQENSYKDAIYDYYKNKMEEAGISSDVRFKIEEALGCENRIKQRVSVNDQDLEDLEFNKKYKDSLVKSNIIRVHALGTEQYVEFTHDRLVEAIYDKHKVEKLQRRNKRLFRVSIIAFALLSIITVLFVNLKRNEKNYLITQAKLIAAEAEKLVKNENIYKAFRLLNYVANNNHESRNVEEFSSLLKNIDYIYDFPNVMLPHDGTIPVDYSSDGRYILTTDDHKIKIWSVEGLDYKMIGPFENLKAAKFIPDTDFIVSVEGTPTRIKLWSAKSCSCHGEYKSNISYDLRDKNPLIVSKNNKSFIVHYALGASLYNVNSSNSVFTIDYAHYVINISLSNDGKYVLSGSSDNAKLWSVEERKCIDTIYLDTTIENNSIQSVIFDNSSKYAIIAGSKKAFLYSVEEKKCIDTITINNSRIKLATFDNNSKYIVIADNKQASLYSIENETIINTFDCGDNIKDIKCSSDGKYIVLLSDKGVKLLSVGDNINESFMITNSEGKSVMFSQNDSCLIVETKCDCIWIYDMKFLKISKRKKLEDNDYDKVLFTPNGKYLITLSGNLLKSWDVNKDKIKPIDSIITIGKNVMFSRDGNYIIVEGNYHEIWLCSIKADGSFSDSKTFSSSKITSDRNNILTPDKGDTNVLVYSISNDRCVDTLTKNKNSYVYEFDYWNGNVIDGKILKLKNDEEIKIKGYKPEFTLNGKCIIAEDDKEMKLWIVEDTLIYIDSYTKKPYFSSDGNYFAVITGDGDVVELKTIKKNKIKTICKIDLEGEKVYYVCFLNDNKYIYTLSRGNLKIWTVEDGKCVGMFDKSRNIVLNPNANSILSKIGSNFYITKIRTTKEINDDLSILFELTEKEKYFLN